MARRGGRHVQRLPSDTAGFEEYVTEKVEADTGNFSLKDFSIDKKMKLKKKSIPSKALQEMASLNAMSDLYKNVFKVYLRCLTHAIDGLAKKSTEYRQLKSVAEALNIDVSKPGDKELAEILARLRALELVEKPPS
jgi:hypothetical protein